MLTYSLLGTKTGHNVSKIKNWRKRFVISNYGDIFISYTIFTESPQVKVNGHCFQIYLWITAFYRSGSDWKIPQHWCSEHPDLEWWLLTDLVCIKEGLYSRFLKIIVHLITFFLVYFNPFEFGVLLLEPPNVFDGGKWGDYIFFFPGGGCVCVCEELTAINWCS